MLVPDKARCDVIEAARKVMDALARRDDAFLEAVFQCSRCEKEDVYRVMEEYGGSFAAPPSDGFDRAYIDPIDGEPSLYAVDAEFWDGAGRMTDLSAQLTIRFTDGVATVEIDDVRTM